MTLPHLKLNEWIFLCAGIGTHAAAPFLGMGGFYLWISVKAIYISGIVILLMRK